VSTKHGRSKDGIDRDKKGKASGDGISGGNMGAGKSGKENLGTEKPTDDKTMGSQKPTREHKKK
jgi:hypothetical protein